MASGQTPLSKMDPALAKWVDLKKPGTFIIELKLNIPKEGYDDFIEQIKGLGLRFRTKVCKMCVVTAMGPYLAVLKVGELDSVDKIVGLDYSEE